MTEKWTPGEWRLMPEDEFGDFAICGPDEKLAIAAVCNGDTRAILGRADEHKANAHLIKAAPVLYRALKGIVFWNGTDDYTEALAALAKARGEA